MSGLSGTDLKALKREARKKGTPPERLLELAALDPQLSRLIAKEHHTPAPVLEKLALSADAITRRMVAAHRNTPPQTLSRLAYDKQVSVLKVVAANGQTPAQDLEHLSRHPKSAVRAALLGLHGTFLKRPMLERLLSDPVPEVRARGLTHHTVLQTDWQRALSDEAGEVRAVAAGQLAVRKSLAAEDWERLIKDPADTLRLALAQRLSVSLAKEDWPHFADLMLTDPMPEVREAVAPFASVEALAAHAADPSGKVREDVAKKCTDEAVLRVLAADPLELVRLRLAENPHTPPDLLNTIIPTIVDVVWLHRFICHPNLNEEGLRLMCQNAEYARMHGPSLLSLDLPPALREIVLRHVSTEYPFRVAMQPDIPDDLAERLQWVLGKRNSLEWAHSRLENHLFRSFLERLVLSPNPTHAEKARHQLAQLKGLYS